MDKKERIKKLLELESLVSSSGSPNRIAALRKELGIDIKEPSPVEVDTENLAMQVGRPEKGERFELRQYARLRALGLNDAEISHALGIRGKTITLMRSLIDLDELKSLIEREKQHKVIQHSIEQRKKRWRYL